MKNKKIYYFVLLKYYTGIFLSLVLCLSPFLIAGYLQYTRSLIDIFHFWSLFFVFIFIFLLYFILPFYSIEPQKQNKNFEKMIKGLAEKTGEKSFYRIKGIFSLREIGSPAALTMCGFRKYYVLFLNNSKIKDADVIYFILLHEVGHIKTNSQLLKYLFLKMRVFFLFLASFSLLASLEYFGSNLNAFCHFAVFLYFIAFFDIALKLSMHLSRWQAEYLSDIIATNLNDNLFQTSIKTLKIFSSKQSAKKQDIFLEGFYSSHPPAQARIKMIEKIFQ